MLLISSRYSTKILMFLTRYANVINETLEQVKAVTALAAIMFVLLAVLVGLVAAKR